MTLYNYFLLAGRVSKMTPVFTGRREHGLRDTASVYRP